MAVDPPELAPKQWLKQHSYYTTAIPDGCGTSRWFNKVSRVLPEYDRVCGRLAIEVRYDLLWLVYCEKE